MVTLESSKLFCNLTAEELQSLRQTAQERSFAAGQDIFKEGESGDGVYSVKEGLVQITALVGPGVRRVFSQVGPGEVFGEMAVLENKPRSATVTAVKNTAVYFIPRDAMLNLLEQSPTLSLGLVREISHRLREFNGQYIREVLQSERLALVGRFARSIVHDVKNPLNIIGLTAELAGRESASVEARQRARSCIVKQVERISNLINEILEFTQGAHGAMVLGATDYAVFVQQLIEDISAEVDLKSVTLELANPPPSVKLLLNPQRLARVFYNLMSNATDAMPDGGKVVLRFDVNDKEVVTEIEDTGPGIAPEIAGNLFEAFATYGKSHGTGLGLSISKKIIEDHHGQISARNQPGHGAIFSFTLPRQR
ncbi:MAG: cyclic nucleotide-binding domain-containing protein [Verrucomicrobia bacterium]|nr:cyclic nucleotide-binding domain-containing protein [Verrucomicrobiota bacterium]